MKKFKHCFEVCTRFSFGIAIGIGLGVALSNSENIAHAARTSLASLQGMIIANEDDIAALETEVADIVFGVTQVGTAAVARSVPVSDDGVCTTPGEVRFNNSVGALEVCDGTEWRRVAYGSGTLSLNDGSSPAGIIINGTLVIDSSGNWVGPPIP